MNFPESAPQRRQALGARNLEEGVESSVKVTWPIVPLAVADFLRRVQRLKRKQDFAVVRATDETRG